MPPPSNKGKGPKRKRPLKPSKSETPIVIDDANVRLDPLIVPLPILQPLKIFAFDEVKLAIDISIKEGNGPAVVPSLRPNLVDQVSAVEFSSYVFGAGAFPAVKAFPSAEGVAADTITGGRGGTVIYVNTLADSGNSDSTHGSLRWALTQTFTRTILFQVSGIITITSEITLTSANSNFTLAAQTSPGGVQIKGNGVTADKRTLRFTSGCNNFIVRHLRYRPGGMSTGASNQSGFVLFNSAGGDVHHWIFDHCSSSWWNDAGYNVYKGTRDGNIQWCLIGEGCNDADPGHVLSVTEGVVDGKFAIHHNVFSNCTSNERFPWLGHGDHDFINNLAYNGREATFGGWQLNMSAHVNEVKNKYIAGADTGSYGWYDFQPAIGNEGASNGQRRWSTGGIDNDSGGTATRGGTKLYIEGSWHYRNPAGTPSDYWSGINTRDKFDSGGSSETQLPIESNVRVGSRFSISSVPITEHATADLEAVLLAAKGVGAWATANSFGNSNRDQADLDIISDISGRTGSHAGVGTGGPWPTLSGSAPTDSNSDGIPDDYSIAHGLSHTTGNHFNTVAPNGYTWGENYINELAGDTVVY